MCLPVIVLPQGRLYRIFDFFAMVDHSMLLSQMALILLRNNTYIFFTCHWCVCGPASCVGPHAPHRGVLALRQSWRQAADCTIGPVCPIAVL